METKFQVEIFAIAINFPYFSRWTFLANLHVMKPSREEGGFWDDFYVQLGPFLSPKLLRVRKKVQLFIFEKKIGF